MQFNILGSKLASYVHVDIVSSCLAVKKQSQAMTAWKIAMVTAAGSLGGKGFLERATLLDFNC